jgi:peptidoglycan-associated lipoprotein
MARLHFSIPTRAVALAGSFLLVACSSTPIAEAPVGSAGTAAAPNTSATAPAQSSVSSVTAGTPAPGSVGPETAARILYFDYDSSEIRPEFQPVIDAHARWLAARQDRRMMIAGHTDERGGREYNLALGQQRAEAVRRAMQLLGVRGTQIETVSFGEEKPATSGQEETAWSRNRRAELTYR